jgi:polar amino acid transport system permease protein
MHFNWALYSGSMSFLLGGAAISLIFAFTSLGLGLVIGLTMALGKLSKHKILRWPASAYIEFIRGTPLLVQIFVLYYALPDFGIYLESFPVGIIAMGMNSGAYVAEIIRSGIISISKGQTEAARSLGLSAGQTMSHVILPQAFRRILPPLGNEFITLTKDSSLVSIIAIQELMFRANIVAARTWDYATMYLGVAPIYFLMTYGASLLVRYMEKRWRIE